MNNNLISNLARTLRLRRHELEMTQEEVALEADMERSYISQIESGKHNVSLLILHRISKALNLKLSELFTRMGQ